ncbi:hypothetical protein [Fibrella aquatilis]|uniref:Uncharacterized protein n=1 Tax=Fibrella aquatilis TaxID=2817059 RepID=A0A939G3E7_9BACT|nr:hypothetical protein [Fibrella aquatilis]MBO0930365.1 hypothetical protein [Fibrella aquatilis]
MDGKKLMYIAIALTLVSGTAIYIDQYRRRISAQNDCAKKKAAAKPGENIMC